MSILARNAKPAPPARCEACHATDTPRRHTVIEGNEMQLCSNVTACCRRWRAVEAEVT